jgi:hypothetical protein
MSSNPDRKQSNYKPYPQHYDSKPYYNRRRNDQPIIYGSELKPNSIIKMQNGDYSRNYVSEKMVPWEKLDEQLRLSKHLKELIEQKDEIITLLKTTVRDKQSIIDMVNGSKRRSRSRSQSKSRLTSQSRSRSRSRSRSPVKEEGECTQH